MIIALHFDKQSHVLDIRDQLTNQAFGAEPIKSTAMLVIDLNALGYTCAQTNAIYTFISTNPTNASVSTLIESIRSLQTDESISPKDAEDIIQNILDDMLIDQMIATVHQ